MRPPIAQRPDAQSLDRRGYTLLELLLVLSVVLILAGLTWPSVQGMHERHRLREAAEEVRLRLAGARVRAIDTGLVYQFRYEAGGREFVVVPFESSGDVLQGLADDASVPVHAGALQEPMRFGFGPNAGPSLGGPGFADASVTGDFAAAPPVLFAPDGTATDAVLSVTDADGQFIEISVRGLTAAVSVGNVRRRTLP